MGPIKFYQILLIFAFGGLVYLAHMRGTRKNKQVIKTISSELEGGINPTKKMYKNLGGSIGYRAFYERNGYLGKVTALFTTLPRQSILVYPFHILFGGHDKLQVNIYSENPIKVNCVIVKSHRNHGKLVQKYCDDGFMKKETAFEDTIYWIYYKDDDSLQFGESLFKKNDMKNVIFFMSSPENSSFHIRMIPRKDAIEPFLRSFLSYAKTYVKK